MTIFNGYPQQGVWWTSDAAGLYVSRNTPIDRKVHRSIIYFIKWVRVYILYIRKHFFAFSFQFYTVHASLQFSGKETYPFVQEKIFVDRLEMLLHIFLAVFCICFEWTIYSNFACLNNSRKHVYFIIYFKSSDIHVFELSRVWIIDNKSTAV